MARARLVELCACASLLGACQSLATDRPPFGITTSAVSDSDVVLTKPRIGEARGMIFVRGDVCSRDSAAASAPRALQVTGYDESRRQMFQRVIVLRPRNRRPGKLCRSYVTALTGVRSPASLEVRAVAQATGSGSSAGSRPDADRPDEERPVDAPERSG